MAETRSFSEVLEDADRLSWDEQQEIVAILKRRLADAGRRRLIDDIRESRQEFTAGKCQPTTADELLREIME
jgi:hypothetical protein